VEPPPGRAPSCHPYQGRASLSMLWRRGAGCGYRARYLSLEGCRVSVNTYPAINEAQEQAPNLDKNFHRTWRRESVRSPRCSLLSGGLAR